MKTDLFIQQGSYTMTDTSTEHNRPSEEPYADQLARLQQFKDDPLYPLISYDPDIVARDDVHWRDGGLSEDGFDATNGHPAIRIDDPDPVIVDETDVGGDAPEFTFYELLAEYGLSPIHTEQFTYVVAGPVRMSSESTSTDR